MEWSHWTTHVSCWIQRLKKQIIRLIEETKECSSKINKRKGKKDTGCGVSLRGEGGYDPL